MGLRTASVRRPHVAVMAPALTDTTNKYLPNATHTHCDELIQAVDTLNSLALASETLLTNKCFTNNPQSMMSSPMGDQQDKMGLQKTGLDTVSNIHKAKSANEVEQLFNNLTSVLPDGVPTDLGQNVEELMQVIKSMEGQNTSNDANDEEFTELAQNLTSFEKELLNDVDVMSMVDQQDEIEIDTLKETQAKEALADLQKKHIKLQRRLDFMKRRVYKLQARHMGQHISGEMAGVFEHVHRLLKRMKESQDNSRDGSVPIAPDVCEKPKPMSYGATKSLVRKLETTAMLQANTASRQRHTTRYFGSGSLEPPTFRTSVTSMVNIPPWSIDSKNELQKVSGMLQAELGLVQKDVDSEATESSSGGESCDEMQTYNNPHQQYLSIQKRALWKYSTERAAIAAIWTWLQAQISDLEYRIRQHTDLHKQIRTGKGAVTLGGVSPPASVPTSPTAINGYRGELPGGNSNNSKSSGEVANGLFAEYQCARTRPIVNFKKRKLLQTAGLHAISKKAARPSSLRCGCVPLSVPCALCTGRTDPTHPRDPPDTLSKAERIALLDPTYHPVFSLPEDTSQSIHLEAIMKTSEWQQRSTRMKTLKVMSRAEKLDKGSLEHRSKKLEHRKKYGRLLKPSTMSALSAKIKNKIRDRKAGRHSLNKLSRKKHSAKMAMAQLHALAAEGVDEEVEVIGNNTNLLPRSIESPNTSPLLHMQPISGYNKKNRIDSYDIDNIVIPYSVAASTRVEKLQYKEILTPKWRLAEPDFSKLEVKNNGVVRNPSQDEDTEDMSEEAVIARHERCEHNEKKKFLSYLKLPIGYGRSRSHKRTDSRADSGTNTPDAMSPHPTDLQDNSSPIGSPPATPMSANADDSTPLPSVSLMRRRTISQSRFLKEKDVKEDRCSTPDVMEVAPYERRTFPLPEDVYDKMLKHMPEDHQLKTNIRAQDSDFISGESYLDDKMDSPGSESTESALGDEDPNDPEWVDMERCRDRHKR